jgi:Fungal specific transcription factor domain.
LRAAVFSGQSPSNSSSRKAKSKNTIMDSLDKAHCRFTVDDRGQFRYFGYSSSMRVVSILPQSISPSKSNSPSGPDDEAIHTVDSEALADSIEVQTHLIDMFFRYQNSALPILDENVFREAYAEGVRSEYFSKFLLYSLLLQALKFGNISHTNPLARIYVQRARAELIFEIENPTISTIPALSLFGYYLASLGSDRACWLYPGNYIPSLFE